IEAQRTAFVLLFTHGRHRHYAHPEFRVHDVVDVWRGAVTSACPTTARKRASARLGEKECHRAGRARANVAVPCGLCRRMSGVEVQTGKHLLGLNLTAFDPKPT